MKTTHKTLSIMTCTLLSLGIHQSTSAVMVNINNPSAEATPLQNLDVSYEPIVGWQSSGTAGITNPAGDAPDGSNVFVLTGDEPSIRQMLSGPSGDAFGVSAGDVAEFIGQVRVPTAQGGFFTVELRDSVTGSLLGSATSDFIPGGSSSYRSRVVSVPINAGSQAPELRITSNVTSQVGISTLLLDSVQLNVNQIPEPTVVTSLALSALFAGWRKRPR